MAILRGGICKQMGFFRQRPKSNKFRPLFNTSKKGNAKSTREGMADTKPRTPPSSACQIYGKVPAKISRPYFAKVLMTGNKTTKYLPKYKGNLHGKRDMCMHHILKNAETQIDCSIMHMQKNWMHNMQPMCAH